MIHKLSELLVTVKTKTTPYHPRSDGLVERFNRTLLAMLAMFVSQEHDNWDDLLPFMMLAYNTTVHTTTGFTPYRLVFGDECNLPGNLVHRELRPDPPPGGPGTYASWVQQALHELYDEVRAQQQRATHRQKRNYDSKDKTARSVADALMDIWLPRYGFPLFLHSDQGKEFDNAMIRKLSELLGTVKTKTTPYHPRSNGLVERFNRTLLAMLAMFVSQEHDNWDDLLPFMMLAYNTTVHTTTGFTPYRLVFGDECNLPGNLVHRELRPDTPPGDPGTYASWVQQALHESYDEVRAQQQRATHRQKRNYDSKAVARTFPIGCWTLRYYSPARKNKLCSPWIGPYKIVRAPMELVVGIQVVYVHMDDLKRCATPDPEPSWPDTARGTSIVVSTRAPSTFAPTDIARSQKPPSSALQQPLSSVHHTDSISLGDTDVRASNTEYNNDEDIVKIDTVPDTLVKIDTVPDSIVTTDTVPISTCDLQDAKCIYQ